MGGIPVIKRRVDVFSVISNADGLMVEAEPFLGSLCQANKPLESCFVFSGSLPLLRVSPLSLSVKHLSMCW